VTRCPEVMEITVLGHFCATVAMLSSKLDFYLPRLCRTQADILLGHYLVLRGENRRMAELADLSLVEFLAKNKGPTPCFAVVL
jgi:hypothetical protein